MQIQRKEREKDLLRYIKPIEGEMAYEKYPLMVGKCTGCGICEAVCSLEHFGAVSRPLSAIKVEKNFYDWMTRSAPHEIAITRNVCRQCPGASACMLACPKKAISRVDGAVKIDDEKCIKCGACARACPYGAVTLVNKQIVKCDLCGGDPQCVKWCPPHVLEYVIVKKGGK